LNHGEGLAACFTPVVAAAQSVPGIFHEADAVYNGTDSALDAAYVSLESESAWEVRMSTGVYGDTALHSIEVVPVGHTLGEVSYDASAWADTTRKECLFGVPQNQYSGAAQPFGALAGSLAVQAFLARVQEQRHYRIAVRGSRITQQFGTAQERIPTNHALEIQLAYDRTLPELWKEVGKSMGTEPSDLLLSFRVPLVVRVCSSNPSHIYQGFERFPVWGKCPKCGSSTIPISSKREVTLDDIPGTLDVRQSLRCLHAPAGMRFKSHARKGEESLCSLPFQEVDIPPMPRNDHRLNQPGAPSQ